MTDLNFNALDLCFGSSKLLSILFKNLFSLSLFWQNISCTLYRLGLVILVEHHPEIGCIVTFLTSVASCW